MKKFTCLLFIILISFVSGAQPTPEWQKKLQQSREKLKQLQQTGTLLMQISIHSGTEREMTTPSLKNAQAALKLDSIVTRISEETDTWQYDYKDEFLYNEEMKNTVWISKEWNTVTNSWYISERIEMEIDNQNRVHSMLTYYREDPEQELTLQNKTDAAYDASGRLESIMSYSQGDGSEWILELKQLYSYDASGKLTGTKTWALDEGEMVETMRTVYSYDASGNMELMQTYFLMGEMEFLFSESQMSYNTSGQLTVEENASINITTFIMEKDNRITIAYNSAGDISAETYASWDAGSQSWIDNERDEYTYGTTNFSEIVYPSLYSLFPILGYELPALIKIITEINTYELISENWEHTAKSNYYYSSSTASLVDLTENEGFSLFPNPVSESVKVSWTGKYNRLSLEIFRIDGTKVMEHPVSSGEEIFISPLDRGIYFFRLLNRKETVFAGKLIKK